MKICPMMSKAAVIQVGDKSQEDLIRIACQREDCALWIVEMGEGKMPIERCGLIK